MLLFHSVRNVMVSPYKLAQLYRNRVSFSEKEDSDVSKCVMQPHSSKGDLV